MTPKEVNEIKKMIKWVNNTGNDKNIGVVKSFWKEKKDGDEMRLFLDTIIQDLVALLPENEKRGMPEKTVPYSITKEDLKIK